MIAVIFFDVFNHKILFLFFTPLHMFEIEALLQNGGTIKKFKRGEFIFKEETACYYYFQLIHGSISWLSIDDEGRKLIHAIIQPGESFGEIPLLDDGLYEASAYTEKDCEVLQMPRNKFLEFLAADNELFKTFSRAIATRLRYCMFIKTEIAYGKPEKTILSLLNYLAANDMSEDATQRIHLTRQNIASILGLRVETVIRTIKNLNNQGLLIVEHGKIYIKR
jgi:CRP-like cAMP-binding protein